MLEFISKFHRSSITVSNPPPPPALLLARPGSFLRPSGAVAGAEPLRHDAFESHLAGVGEDGRMSDMKKIKTKLVTFVTDNRARVRDTLVAATYRTLGLTAMTMTNASSSIRGRRIKFTPQVIEKIKEFVAEGISRDEIANRLGVTVGSLQVTCSRLGISLRRIILPNGSGHHTADVRRRTLSPQGSVGIAHVREQKVSQPTARAAPVPQFAITMRHKGEEKTTDIPLPSPAIEALALEATSRDLSIAELIGQVLVAAINKDMIQKILRN